MLVSLRNISAGSGPLLKVTTGLVVSSPDSAVEMYYVNEKTVYGGERERERERDIQARRYIPYHKLQIY